MSDPEQDIHLFIPGPAGVTPEVMEAFCRPIEPHYGSSFVAVYDRCVARMQRIFRTDNDLFLMVGPGTAALDAGLGSALPERARVLVPTNGWFADRLARICEANGATVDALESRPGDRLDLEAILVTLSAHDYDAVAWVHHETSTGVLNPVEPIAAAARERGTLSVLDAIASLGGTELPVDGWGVDLCVGVSNKCLAAPPGLAAISVSSAAWEAVECSGARRGWYQDLRNWRWYRDNWTDWHPYPTTVSTAAVHALDVALEQLLAEGLERRLARTVAAARATRVGLRNLGFEMFCDDAIASPVTTSVRAHQAISIRELIAYLREGFNIFVSGGIGDLHGQIFRIGHMGASIDRDEVEYLLRAIEQAVRATGVDVPDGTALEGIWEASDAVAAS